MSTVWTLLITDDCAEDREIYREYLAGDPYQSYQFLEAASAEVGLALCQKKHCDALLLDFCLPDMSGLEFLDELRQQGLAAEFPIIMLTGQGDESVAVQAIKRGAQDYLVKQDLEPDTLQVTVRNVIQQSHLQKQFDKTQAPQQLPATIALRIRASLNAEQILQTAVSEVQHLLECDRVAIYKLMPADVISGIPDRLTQVSASGLGHAPESIAQFLAFLSQPPPLTPGTLTAATTQRSRKKPLPESSLLIPIQLPVADAATPAWGLLVASQNSETGRWQPDEVEILNELAEQLAIALQQAEYLDQTIRTLEQTQQLNAFQSHLLAQVSHAYRTPLTTILAAASTLEQHSNQLDGAQSQRCLALITAKARQMTQLVEDLLVLETLEAGKAAFLPIPFEVLQFFSDIVEAQRQTLDASYELTFTISGNTRGFRGDQKLLRQILVNLLSNAVKYSPTGGKLEVRLTGTASQIMLAVTDTGMGIAIAERDRIFECFQRGSNVGSIPGIGIGLAIVKACVELHGGEITVASQPTGTTFTVSLPK